MKLLTEIVISAKDKTKSAFASTRAGVTSISDRLAGLHRQALAFIGVSFFVDLAADVIETSDAFKLTQARIEQATESTTEFNQVSEDLLALSQRTSTGLDKNARLYVSISKVVKEFTGNQRDALTITETLAQSLKLSNANTAESASLTRQFTQALQSGVLRGDEFNSVMENGGRVVDALSDALGKSRGELRQMAEDGQLTADVVLSALLSQSDVIASEFAELPDTVGSAMQRINNSVVQFIGQVDESTGATESLAGALSFVAENFDEIIGKAPAAAKLIGAIYTGKLLLSADRYSQSVRESAQAEQQANDQRRRDIALSDQQVNSLKRKISETERSIKSTSSAAVGEKTLDQRRKQLKIDTDALTQAEKRLQALRQTHLQTMGAATKATRGLAKITQTLSNTLGGLALGGIYGALAAAVFDVTGKIFNLVQANSELNKTEKEKAKNAADNLIKLQVEAEQLGINTEALGQNITAIVDAIEVKRQEIAAAEAAAVATRDFDAEVAALAARSEEASANVKKLAEQAGLSVSKFIELNQSSLDIVSSFTEWSASTDGLDAALKKLSLEELQQKITDASDAIKTGVNSTETLKTALNQLSQESLRRLGVDFDSIISKMDGFEKTAVASFIALSESGELSAQQLEQVRLQLIELAETPEQLEALKEEFEQQGIQLTDNAEQAKLYKDRLNELKSATDAVGSSTDQLGGAYDQMSNRAVSAMNALQSELNELRQENQQLQNELDNTFNKRNGQGGFAVNQGFDAQTQDAIDALSPEQFDVFKQVFEKQVNQTTDDRDESLAAALDAAQQFGSSNEQQETQAPVTRQVTLQINDSSTGDVFQPQFNTQQQSDDFIAMLKRFQSVSG